MERFNGMIDTEAIINEYERFRILSQQMLESIKKGEWDHIADIGGRREKQLQSLMALDDTPITDPAERMRWSDLIRRCLEMNREMQALIEEKTGELLKNYNDEKKMYQAYHLNSGG
jgi:hypothetical protein